MYVQVASGGVGRVCAFEPSKWRSNIIDMNNEPQYLQYLQQVLFTWNLMLVLCFSTSTTIATYLQAFRGRPDVRREDEREVPPRMELCNQHFQHHVIVPNTSSFSPKLDSAIQPPPMDATLQEQFNRLQSALETLVDSIAAYNPSAQAASELLAADDALGRGLDQLAQHQANHRRIQSLRAHADALEEQLRTSVATLAGLRRELFDTPATTFPSDSRPVPASELLLYAKNISQYTVPPTYREPVLAVPVEENKSGSTAAQATPVNTAATAANDTQTSNGEPALEPITDVTVEEAEWLKKLQESNTAWVPWPSDEKIRSSNLMQIQYLLDTGKDPKLVDLTKLGEDEKENIAADAQHAADRLHQANVESHRAQHSTHPPAAPRPPVETFAGFDFLDDDDD